MARKLGAKKSGQTVLVVDDQEETLVSVRMLLEREGHEVLTAESAEQALRVFKEREIHLLLVDYFMPRVTGEQLIREIRTFDPYVQIILQTGYSGQKPPRLMLAELDIQGYHDKADGPEPLLLWVDVGLKAARLIQNLQERERLQRELVANISHEFRTPLNVIAGYTDLLLDEEFGPLPGPAAGVLRRVEAATVNLQELVEDFLRYAQLEAGVMAFTEAEIRIADLVAELQRFAALLIDGKDLRFTLDAATAPATFVGDVVKVRTIIRNLLANAVKFTRAGSVGVRITGEAAQLQFVVSDTGPGIRAQDIDVIFEPFRQLDGSNTRAHGGIGLGLALCRKLAAIIGGSIEVSSQLGIGSSFTLSVPADRNPTCAGTDFTPLVGVSA